MIEGALVVLVLFLALVAAFWLGMRWERRRYVMGLETLRRVAQNFGIMPHPDETAAELRERLGRQFNVTRTRRTGHRFEL